MLLLKSRFRFSLILAATLLTEACADKRKDSNSDSYNTPAVLFIEPELQPHLANYIADAAAAGVAVSDQKLQELQGLMWTDHIKKTAAPDATILGHCQRHPGLRFVEILRPNSEGKAGNIRVDEITLKVMIYHELGHCLHDFSGHISGGSAAIMSAQLQPARYINLDGLLRDHFLMLKQKQENPSFRP